MLLHKQLKRQLDPVLLLFDIRDELLANNYIEDSYEYLKEIEMRIYKMFPERIKKYYSYNN